MISNYYLLGGCSNYLIGYLQTLQNRAGRLVTKHGQFTPTRVVLRQCGWLSVKQLVHFHSLLLVFKIKMKNKPEYFNQHFSSEFPYRTRLATSSGIRREEQYRYDVTMNSFAPRSSLVWNQLPVKLRNMKTTNTFKKNLKTWIQDNVPAV